MNALKVENIGSVNRRKDNSNALELVDQLLNLTLQRLQERSCEQQVGYCGISEAMTLTCTVA